MLTASLLLAAAALTCEALFGYPQALYRAIGHPVTWIGALIRRLDRMLNREGDSFLVRKLGGCLALVLLLAITGGVAFALQWALTGWAGFVLLALLAASLPAQRSLYEHVADVAQALETQGLEGGRRAVSMIVGRNTAVLDEAGVARAAIESDKQRAAEAAGCELVAAVLGVEMRELEAEAYEGRAALEEQLMGALDRAADAERALTHEMLAVERVTMQEAEQRAMTEASALATRSHPAGARDGGGRGRARGGATCGGAGGCAGRRGGGTAARRTCGER